MYLLCESDILLVKVNSVTYIKKPHIDTDAVNFSSFTEKICDAQY